MKICVVGCERSGTSAISTLLSMGYRCSFLDDPKESWYEYPLMYKHNYNLSPKLWWKIQRNDVVKVPGFATVLTSLRRQLLSNFETVYCVRNPLDTIASIQERLSVGYNGLYTNTDWLKLKVNVQSPTESLAWRWRRYLECALDYQNQNGKIIFLRYEDFANNKSKCLNDLTSQLSWRKQFDWKNVEDNLDKQFRKGWSSEIQGRERWKKDLSKETIEIIVSVCKPLMEEWGYVS